MPREQSHGWAARLRLLSRNPREIAGIVDRTSVRSDPLAGRERDVSKSSSPLFEMAPLAQGNFAIVLRLSALDDSRP
jgi:hypothetical protein